MMLAGAGLFSLMLASPAQATNGGSGGFCGGTDKNGCTVSPVTYKSCSKDLKGDIKDLKCDIIDLIRDVFHNGSTGDLLQDIKDIQADLAEIKYDYAVLATLKKSHPKGGYWHHGHWFWW